jgi:hypothetical protein
MKIATFRYERKACIGLVLDGWIHELSAEQKELRWDNMGLLTTRESWLRPSGLGIEREHRPVGIDQLILLKRDIQCTTY